MESWFLSKYKPWLCGFFICIMMLPIFMVGQIQGVCIEEERKALLEIKASLNDFCYTYKVGINLLPTWVDHGNTGGSECCDWERVKCHTTTGHVTDLSLGNMIAQPTDDWYEIGYVDDRIWRLNVSLFLHFKELRSLDLSFNHIDDTILSTGLERLSSLKRLETFNLSDNSIGNGLFSSLGAVISLKILDLSYTSVSGQARHQNDISILASLENLVVLKLTDSNSYGTFQMQGGSEKLSRLKSLETLYLGHNQFNETLIMSLSAIPSLKEVDLSDIPLSGPLPAEGCKSLSRLKRLETITLRYTHLDEGVISCLSFLPSLKSLDLSYSNSTNLGSSFPMQEFRELEALDLSYCELRSLTTNGTINNKLVRLMLHGNSFNADVMRSITAFPSLRILSMNYNFIGPQKLGNGLFLSCAPTRSISEFLKSINR